MPEPLLKEQTVFLLAGGHGLTQAVVDRLKGRRCIVINSSCHKAIAAGLDGEVLFFTDHGWFKAHREIVETWQGPVISVSRGAKRDAPGIVKRIECEQRKGFAGEKVRSGRSSGHTAVSLAIAMGAARIILLGYDMRVVDGREHHHADYTGPRDLDIYQREFIPAFAGWNAAALAVGVTILNATPGSALTEFPMVDLADEL